MVDLLGDLQIRQQDMRSRRADAWWRRSEICIRLKLTAPETACHRRIRLPYQPEVGSLHGMVIPTFQSRPQNVTVHSQTTFLYIPKMTSALPYPPLHTKAPFVVLSDWVSGSLFIDRWMQPRRAGTTEQALADRS